MTTVTVQRSFIDFLKTVDMPKERDEEFCLKAGTAFLRNEVLHFIAACEHPGMYVVVVPSDVRCGGHHGVQC